MVVEASARMPLNVRIALVGVWFQAVGNALGAFVVLIEVDNRLSHGQEVPQLGVVRALAYLSFILAGTLVACGVLAWKRFAWIRTLILVIEGLAVAGALVGLLSSGTAAPLLGLAIAVVVAGQIAGSQGREWFNR